LTTWATARASANKSCFSRGYELEGLWGTSRGQRTACQSFLLDRVCAKLSINMDMTLASFSQQYQRHRPLRARKIKAFYIDFEGFINVEYI